MPLELQSLFVVSSILLMLLFIQGSAKPLSYGFKWGLGPRDQDQAPTVLIGRLNRIIANHLEGMAMFIPLVVIVELGGLSSSLTAAGAVTFAVGRALFAIVYLIGMPVLRSAMWGVALIGLLMMGFAVATAAFG